MAVANQAHAQLRAYLEYFRDMGVYDFYRNGEPTELVETVEETAVAVEVEVVEPAVAARSVVAPALSSPVFSSPQIQVEHTPEPMPVAAVAMEFDIPKLISFNDLAPPPLHAVSAGVCGTAHDCVWRRRSQGSADVCG
jgi:hypothetical protein